MRKPQLQLPRCLARKKQSKQADVTSCSNSSDPLYIACCKDHRSSVRELVRNWAPNDKRFETHFTEARALWHIRDRLLDCSKGMHAFRVARKHHTPDHASCVLHSSPPVPDIAATTDRSRQLHSVSQASMLQNIALSVLYQCHCVTAVCAESLTDRQRASMTKGLRVAVARWSAAAHSDACFELDGKSPCCYYRAVMCASGPCTMRRPVGIPASHIVNAVLQLTACQLALDIVQPHQC